MKRRLMTLFTVLCLMFSCFIGVTASADPYIEKYVAEGGRVYAIAPDVSDGDLIYTVITQGVATAISGYSPDEHFYYRDAGDKTIKRVYYDQYVSITTLDASPKACVVGESDYILYDDHMFYTETLNEVHYSQVFQTYELTHEDVKAIYESVADLGMPLIYYLDIDAKANYDYYVYDGTGDDGFKVVNGSSILTFSYLGADVVSAVVLEDIAAVSSIDEQIGNVRTTETFVCESSPFNTAFCEAVQGLINAGKFDYADYFLIPDGETTTSFYSNVKNKMSGWGSFGTTVMSDYDLFNALDNSYSCVYVGDWYSETDMDAFVLSKLAASISGFECDGSYEWLYKKSSEYFLAEDALTYSCYSGKNKGTYYIFASDLDNVNESLHYICGDETDIRAEDMNSEGVLVITVERINELLESGCTVYYADYLTPIVEPEMVESPESVLDIEAGGYSALFVSSDEFENFQKVLVNDVELKQGTDYTVEEGSIKVTLTDAYLNSLATGKYTLSIVSQNGTVSAEFEIKAKTVVEPKEETKEETQEETKEEVKEEVKEEAKTDVTPKTGDAASVAMLLALMFACAAVVVVFLRKRTN